MKKVLYFEGTGNSSTDISSATVRNRRIRTAFHLDNGQAVYLDIIGIEESKGSSSKIFRWPYTGFVITCHYITDDCPNDKCNRHSLVLPGDRKNSGWTNARTFEYTNVDILKFVNALGASFDDVKVVSGLGEYHVFQEGCSCAGSNGYNYGDEF